MLGKRKRFTTTKFIMFSFLGAILIGTLLLSLPIATVSGESNILTALFTATTSVCVTGLVVVDTFSYWTIFGKMVILCLIQIGGLGIIAIISAVIMMTGSRMSLKSRMRLHDSFGLDSMEGLLPFFKKVLLGTFTIEFLGALLYLPVFLPKYGTKGIGYAIFNSVSAFCNAGLDILGTNSLGDFTSAPLVLLNTSMLIVLGGLGFVVWFDVLDKITLCCKGQCRVRDIFRKLSTHSKVVLSITLFLLLSGTAIILLLETSNPATLGNMSTGDRILNGFFESVTLRTAGFASFDQGGLRQPTTIASIAFMLIGGSPVGTAGGIKTVTFAVLFYTILSVIKGSTEATTFRRRIDEALIHRALAVTAIYIMLFLVFSMLLIGTNPISLEDGIFEVGSALATVGLSRGITSSLNDIGKIIIILAMYLGRIGPITLFIAFGNRYSSGNSSSSHAKADLIVG